MNPLRFTLVTDGSSDEVLLHPLRWLLLDLGANCPVEPKWADLRGLPGRSTTLKDRIKDALENLPLQATELPPRRLRSFRAPQAIRRVGELITDFSPLNQLPAFVALRAELDGILRAHRWN